MPLLKKNKTKRFQMNDLCFLHKKLEKEEKIKAEVIRRKLKIKIESQQQRKSVRLL